jgi:hypothetical protein
MKQIKENNKQNKQLRVELNDFMGVFGFNSLYIRRIYPVPQSILKYKICICSQFDFYLYPSLYPIKNVL